MKTAYKSENLRETEKERGDNDRVFLSGIMIMQFLTREMLKFLSEYPDDSAAVLL